MQNKHCLTGKSITQRAVVIFAHNESERIVTCLDALKISPLPPQTTCYLIANGCTDDTVQVAREYAKTARWLKVVDLDLGDKSNAWNYFIYEVAPDADVYFFTDGDCAVEPEALQYLESAIQSSSNVNAASAVPGFHKFSFGTFRREIRSRGGLAGNLYALSGSFVSRLKKINFRLPVGLIGDDSLVGAIALWDLNTYGEWDYDRLKVVALARFRYESILHSSLIDPAFYIKRLSRYSIRYFQNKLVGEWVRVTGASSLPSHVVDLYLDSGFLRLKPRASLTHYLFDYLALREMNRKRIMALKTHGHHE